MAFKGWPAAYDARDDISLIAMKEGMKRRGFVFDPTDSFAVLDPDGAVVDSHKARAYVAAHGKPARPATPEGDA